MSDNTKTLITIKTDKTLKKAAQELAENIGLPLGTLINSFLKQFVRTKEVTFSVSYKPNKRLIDAIERGRREYSTGELKEYNTIEELRKDLMSE